MHINYDLVKVTDKDKVGIFLKLLTYCWSTWEKGVGVPGGLAYLEKRVRVPGRVGVGVPGSGCLESLGEEG